MNGHPPPARRPAAGGPRRPRVDETLPGVQFRVVEDLTRITADDELLDAIAAGGADLRSAFTMSAVGGSVGPVAVPDVFGGGRRPVGLGPLLMAWRSELLEPPMPALPTLASRPMLAPADRSRRRSMRSLLSVGLAIGALLVASTAVGARSAQPGQPLWGLSQVLWSDHADSVEAKVRVEAAIDVAKIAMRNGDTTAARQALLIADGEVGKVLPVDGRDALRHDLGVLKRQAGGVADSVVSQPGSVAPVVGSRDAESSFRGGPVPPVVAATSGARVTAAVVPSGVLPHSAATRTVVSSTGLPGTGTGAGGNPPSSVTDVPVVPVVPATSSSPPVVIGPVATANPVTTAAPGTTVGSIAPVGPTATAPVDTSASGTRAPVTTGPPAATPPTAAPTAPDTTAAPTPTDASTTTAAPTTTDAPTTADPSTSSQDPSTSSAEPTLASPTEASTTSELPTTVGTTPMTDSNGSTTGDTATTTQTAPVNSTDNLGSTTVDPGTLQPGQDPATAGSTDAARDTAGSAAAAGR